MNILPNKVKSTSENVKKMKRSEKVTLCCKKSNFGEKNFRVKIKNPEIKSEVIPEIVKQEFMCLFFSLLLIINGKNLIKNISNPKAENAANNIIDDMSVDANPICSEE
jgi:hypothetical protein